MVDSPPVLGISDASVISQEVDVTLLLIQHRRYPRNVSQRAKRVIEEVGGKLFGVILNNVNIKTDDNYYYYAGYSTQYGYKKREARAPRGTPRRAPVPESVQEQSQPSPAPEAGEVALNEQQEDAGTTPSPRVTYVSLPKEEDRF
jgi:Mrp family chromosome partitioning ATPase